MRENRASERTRKATSCVNLCTQRVACDSNTGRFFPPASSPPPPPPLSSSSPLSNSHERPADLQKTTSAISCRRRGCYLHLDSGPDPRKQKGTGRRRGETKKRQKGKGDNAKRRKRVPENKEWRKSGRRRENIRPELGTSHLHNIQGCPVSDSPLFRPTSSLARREEERIKVICHNTFRREC